MEGNIKQPKKKPGKPSIGNFSLVMNAQKGIGIDLAFEIAESLLISNEELSQILHLTAKTLRNYQKENKNLNPIASEQVLKLNELRIRGEQVFGSVEAFMRWMKKPAFGLDGRVPFHFLQTSGGMDLIMEELEAIAHGDFS
ncbi:MAG: antitoxin Xre/MbcA/ParS toxin-binding domain-containing protein [Cyclobacteriaceae bacterium]